MKLIVLYGAPASGKYTIAKLLAEKLGYKFFHNHVTVDMLKQLFEFGTPGFFELSDKIRLDVFEEAAKQNISGMIFTFVYHKEAGDGFVRNIIERVRKYGGEVKFIQIYCDKNELIKRVGQEQRIQAKKMVSSEKLLNMFDRGDFQSAISFVESTCIDNTSLSIEETLEKVIAALE